MYILCAIQRNLRVSILHESSRWNTSVYLQGDILVSELLGSFGDNELSPECLDGVQPFLKRKLYTRTNAFSVQVSF